MTIEALLVFVLLDVGFRVFGFAPVFLRVERWGRRSVSAGAVPFEVQRHTVRRVLAAVQTATRYYHRRRLDCLPRAVATYLLLRRRGVSATLHIGVKRYPFGAHAWVECLGEVLDDSKDDWRHEPYVPIFSTREPVSGSPGLGNRGAGGPERVPRLPQLLSGGNLHGGRDASNHLRHSEA